MCNGSYVEKTILERHELNYKLRDRNIFSTGQTLVIISYYIFFLNLSLQRNNYESGKINHQIIIIIK